MGLFDRLYRLYAGQSARAGYIAASDQALISAANFLATIILARNVSPTELGIYGVGFTALRLVRAVQEGLTIQPMNTYGAVMDESRFRQYATSTSIIQILLALLFSGLTAATGILLTRLGNDMAGPATFSLWLPVLWWQCQEYIRRMMYTRGNILGATINTALANIVRLALMLWWVSQGDLTGIDGLTAIGLGSLVALLPGLWQTRRYWSRSFDNLSVTWSRNWKFARYMLGATLTNWVTVEFYPVLTAGMISFAAAGAYRAIQNLVQPVQLILRAIDTFLTPRMAKAYDSEGLTSLKRQLRLSYTTTALPIFGILALGIIFRDQILYILYGDTYLPYSNTVILMAIFYALWYAYWPLQTAIKAMHRSRPIFIANIVAIIAMFTIGVWFIQRWGVYGTITGQALNAALTGAILWSYWISFQRGAPGEIPQTS
jgi:O-antigen/teichoic acid export membrane protein